MTLWLIMRRPICERHRVIGLLAWHPQKKLSMSGPLRTSPTPEAIETEKAKLNVKTIQNDRGIFANGSPNWKKCVLMMGHPNRSTWAPCAITKPIQRPQMVEGGIWNVTPVLWQLFTLAPVSLKPILLKMTSDFIIGLYTCEAVNWPKFCKNNCIKSKQDFFIYTHYTATKIYDTFLKTGSICNKDFRLLPFFVLFCWKF